MPQAERVRPLNRRMIHSSRAARERPFLHPLGNFYACRVGYKAPLEGRCSKLPTREKRRALLSRSFHLPDDLVGRLSYRWLCTVAWCPFFLHSF
jgi:hypothetical protein